ncbi:MAG: AraC family transcriptional regulator [Betaproteobacteria bacterium PRO3]|nr:AraC family transcriptional regulator [Betaproteobacteria bacterium PRO3]
MSTTARRPAFRPPPPPIHASTFRSDDVDEARAFVARSDGEHSRVVHGTGPLSFERHVLARGRVAVGWGRAGLAQTIRGAAGSLLLQVPVDAPNDYALGRRRIRVAPGSAMIVAPGWEFTRRGEPGLSMALAASVDAVVDEVEARMPTLLGRAAIQSRAIDLRESDRVALEAAVAELSAPPAAASPASRHALGEARSIALLAEILLRGKGVAQATPLGAARCAVLEGWIDAHLHEPLTIGDLCRVAGVGERSLQLTFASLRGVSPMRYVAERRLAAARRLLVRLEPGTDVTSVATAVGLPHLGRFAAMYRRAYGESPSRTLKS